MRPFVYSAAVSLSLGAVLIAAAAAKVQASSFRARSAALFLPTLEIILGASLLSAPAALLPLSAAAGFFGLGCLLLTRELLRGDTSDCGCFGDRSAPKPLSSLRAGLFMIAAVSAIWAASPRDLLDLQGFQVVSLCAPMLFIALLLSPERVTSDDRRQTPVAEISCNRQEALEVSLERVRSAPNATEVRELGVSETWTDGCHRFFVFEHPDPMRQIVAAVFLAPGGSVSLANVAADLNEVLA